MYVNFFGSACRFDTGATVGGGGVDIWAIVYITIIVGFVCYYYCHYCYFLDVFKILSIL